jgi:hypothetical protein
MIGLIGWLLPVVPGFVLVPVGLAILATEFVWARHVLRKVKQSASDVAGWFTGSTQAAPKGDGAPPEGTSKPAADPPDPHMK